MRKKFEHVYKIWVEMFSYMFCIVENIGNLTEFAFVWITSPIWGIPYAIYKNQGKGETMKELIDASVLVRDINADPYRTESEKSYDRCLVHRQPTVDAVEVVHGRWIIEINEPNYKLAVCSVCRNNAEGIYNYCPNCGAKMDGGTA